MAGLARFVREPLSMRVRQARSFCELVDTMTDTLAEYSPFPAGDWRTRSAAEVFVVLCATWMDRVDHERRFGQTTLQVVADTRDVVTSYESMPTSVKDVVAAMKWSLSTLRSPDGESLGAAQRPLLGAAERFDRLGALQQRLVVVPLVRYVEEMAYESLADCA